MEGTKEGSVTGELQARLAEVAQRQAETWHGD